MHWLFRLCMLLVLSVVSSVATAQSLGERVRVTTSPPDARFDGYVQESPSDSLQLRLTNSNLLSVPREDIVLLERYMGKRTYKKRGLLIGGGAGALAGITAGLLAEEDCGLISFFCGTQERLETTAMLAGIFGLTSGAVGMVVGAVIERDQWEEIPGSRTSRIRLSPMFNVSYNEHSGQTLWVGVRARL
ncbi:MAG: hypothetical protein F4207_03975 [Gemmatimonadetes bacterium]|nr:hypothetical protein [Gemmatimonadota bacterium]MYG15576.1 hypothetical protein [Gemmatimonadota bacterium]